MGYQHIVVFRLEDKRRDTAARHSEHGSQPQLIRLLLEGLHNLGSIIPQLAENPEHDPYRAEVPSQNELVIDLTYQICL